MNVQTTTTKTFDIRLTATEALALRLALDSVLITGGYSRTAPSWDVLYSLTEKLKDALHDGIVQDEADLAELSQ